MTGFVIGGSALALILSAFLPWVSALGVVNASPTGGGLVVILALGGTLGFLATRVLQAKATKVVRVVLWILAAIDALVVLGFFVALKAAGQGVGGVLEATDIVRPAFGFYLALIALIVSIVGTIMLQTVKSGPGTAPPGAVGPPWPQGYPATTSISPPNGHGTGVSAPPALQSGPVQPRLNDERTWWDGVAFRSLDEWHPSGEVN